MLSVFFAAVFALSATSSVGVVVSRRPLYAALSLVVNMLSLALLFVMLSAQFLAAAQVIVYAGAVMVLFVFVIALLNPLREDSPVRDPSRGSRRCSSAPAWLLGPGGGFPWPQPGGRLRPQRHPSSASAAGDHPGGGAPALTRDSPSPSRPPRWCWWWRPWARSTSRGASNAAPGLFLLLSAMLFVTGAAGVLLRRNPLVVFMCVELMLNAGNLALLTFSRYHRNMEGQVFALIVIAVAASEVVVGLALMVAIYKSGRAMDIDEMSEMRG